MAHPCDGRSRGGRVNRGKRRLLRRQIKRAGRERRLHDFCEDKPVERPPIRWSIRRVGIAKAAVRMVRGKGRRFLGIRRRLHQQHAEKAAKTNYRKAHKMLFDMGTWTSLIPIERRGTVEYTGKIIPNPDPAAFQSVPEFPPAPGTQCIAGQTAGPSGGPH